MAQNQAPASAVFLAGRNDLPTIKPAPPPAAVLYHVGLPKLDTSRYGLDFVRPVAGRRGPVFENPPPPGAASSQPRAGILQALPYAAAAMLPGILQVAAQHPDAVNDVMRATARGVPGVGPWLDDLNAHTVAAFGTAMPKFVNQAIGLDGDSYGERHDRQLARENATDAGFDRSNPAISAGLQTAGTGLGMAAETIMTGGGSLGGTLGARALGSIGGRILPRLPGRLASTAMRVTAGTGAAPRMLRSAAGGVVLGGIEGLGDGGEAANAGNAALLNGGWDGAASLAGSAFAGAMPNRTLGNLTREGVETVMDVMGPRLVEKRAPRPFGRP